ncbi:MAG TPA: hypothetical protein VFR86_11990, partial [Burkholderiaceae bacterium]|nr:hypothetical protein [Burkholderiaceae bacterium]
MAINFGNIVSSANVLQAPCGGGRFRIDVVVNGVENGAGGTYNVFVYDDDFLFDDLLAQQLNVAVPAGAGAFRNIHRFMLNCDGRCDVVGPLGSSGERKAEIYAFVREARVFGNAKSSNIT